MLGDSWDSQVLCMSESGGDFEQIVEEIRRRGHGPSPEDLQIWQAVVDDPISFWTLRTLLGMSPIGCPNS